MFLIIQMFKAFCYGWSKLRMTQTFKNDPRIKNMPQTSKRLSQKNPQKKNQNQHPFCPKYVKVWISRKKSSWPNLGSFQAHFPWAEKKKKTCGKIAYFLWWANGPYSPGLGQSASFTLEIFCEAAADLSNSALCNWDAPQCREVLPRL